ncbi:MAG TPA: hypothetical protein VMF56_09310 [Acidobacteriaceae bacterium]|nr:hypothetical protein [Acidobacteriaceae bacterium]
MPLYGNTRSLSNSLRRAIPAALFLLLGFTPMIHAQKHEDFDQYRLRLDGGWFYSTPSGTIQGEGDTVPVDFQKDLGFNSYSTFATGLDWKFTRKNHFLIDFSRFNSSHQTVLQRTITFQGQTFEAGLQTQGQLDALFISPGYQYDIIRRKRGHLGIAVHFNTFDTSAKISAQAQVTGDGTQYAAKSASGSFIAPIPVAGPQYRLYLTNSPRLFVTGDVYGMYFFGYGNYVSLEDSLGYAVNKHVSLKAGYALATRLIVNAQTDRIGIHLTQKGATAGLEFSF